MLYLIRTFGRGRKKTALKIGYSGNIKARFTNYKLHNPFFEPISQREGNLVLETKIHLYLTALGYKEKFLDEWFYDCSEVLSCFHTGINKIDKTIWKHRNKLFNKKDFKDSENLKTKIYEELRMINIIKNPQEIDKAWKMEFNKKVLKNIRDKEYGEL